MALRRFLVCFDGTWNTPDSGEKPTNVVKLLRAVCNQAGGVSQTCFYEKGVGTDGPVDRLLGGASGKGLTANLVNGYRFLANNVDSDDEIYVFGFSRGAYTARSLVGFIALAGLLSPLELGRNLGRVLEVYREEHLSLAQKRERIDELGINRRPDVGIRCVGVWDTVGSLGIPGDLGRRLAKKYYFHDVQLSSKVDVALHAVAIDEKRSAFAPTLWVRKEDDAPVEGQTVEQVWFCGVHSNIGGSYADAGLSDIALEWMIKRVAANTGLAFDEEYIREHVKPDIRGDGIDSRTALYKGSVAFPYQRLVNQCIPKGSGIGDWFRDTFRSLDRRNIPPEGSVFINERIHVSTLERWAKTVVHDNTPDTPYRPSNLAAAIRRHSRDGGVPVVGWDGEIIPGETVKWPPVD
ncbi:DUF2235 domain-containing protein [Nitrococcus mobilis]|uniref:T6SS Phospholipase effector Tle1-like catalytic domain-containing protein n=1 Tax=Nitrococcus mobilis Nb-231 TaxID=314278 RepID=A4BN23_9GAMM|nr:DUF2235 domain-containing protein [Nitrococcus mobilis]EAR22622.1 hypothetical protein NB231_09228 [Nitrococcus mobilis Nb-231]